MTDSQLSRKETPYKIDTGPIPLDVVNQPGQKEGECWYRIPSWRVYFDCEALKGVDVRLHRSIASCATWTLTEATTGFKMFGDLAHDQYIGDEGSMLAEFCAGRMLQLTPAKVAAGLAKAREILTTKTPNPFIRSETERSPESYEGQIKAQHQVIAELQAKAKRWQEIADQRAIEVADLKIERGELALKLAGAECFIEEQRKKGNIK